MKSFWISAPAIVFVACQGNTQDKIELKTQKDTVSYSIGTDIGKNLKAQSIEINAQALAHGIADAIAGKKMLLTDQQIQDAMARFQKELAAKTQEKASAMAEKNNKDGKAFLLANKAKEGVKTTASGLQFKVIKEGTGPKPRKDQHVTVHFRATLVDGTEFDNSYKRGEPLTFSLGSVIPGWIEGLQLMSVGSKYVLYIPVDLGYGDRGMGAAVPPGSTLILEVELLSIQ